jgi:hypothetical protein
MTFVLTINGPETVWLLADRRLSQGNRVVTDDALKAVVVQCSDGVAILGYAGLGRTAKGTEPADWMAAVLRGRNEPVERSLGIIADAAKREFPSHLRGKIDHAIISTVFIGQEARVYSINLFTLPNAEIGFRFVRCMTPYSPLVARTWPIAFGGSGAAWLQKREKLWAVRKRELFHLVRACDRGKIFPYAVADYMAKINLWVHEGEKQTVGPRCVVVWRNRTQGIHKMGGAHHFYDGKERIRPDRQVSIIDCGIDVAAIVKTMMPATMAAFLATGSLAIDMDKMNAKITKLPDKSDERLR